MGVGSSSLSELYSIEVQSISPNDTKLNRIFASEIFFDNNSIFFNQFFKIYSKQPKNIRILMSRSIDELESILSNQKERSLPEKFPFSLIVSIISIIRYILPLLEAKQDSYLDDIQRIQKVYFLLIQCLHIQGITLFPKSHNWSDVPSFSDDKFDSFRLIIIENLIILSHIIESNEKLLKVQSDESSNPHFSPLIFKDDVIINHIGILTRSILNCFESYSNFTRRKQLSNLQQRQILIGNSLILLHYLYLKTGTNFESFNISSQEILTLHSYLFKSLNRSNGNAEMDSFIIPLLLFLVKAMFSDNSLINLGELSLGVNILHIIDRYREKANLYSVMYTISFLSSFSSLALSLNVPCEVFESNWPLHRGTHTDIFIEIISRTTLLSPKMYGFAAISISSVLPYSANLSYSSAISIFTLLENLCLYHSKAKKVMKYLIHSIHFCINRSIRENIPLMIVMMKKLELLNKINQILSADEECQQLIVLVKSINSELRQTGNSFTSAKLEKFFCDPSCEYFASPVFKRPSIDFDFKKGFSKTIEDLIQNFDLQAQSVTSIISSS